MHRKAIRATTVFALAIGANATAQTPASTPAPTFIDIGNIRAPHYPLGDMWWDPTNTRKSGLEYPKGDTNQLWGFGAVMFGGRDANGQLRVAGNYFRDPGTDFQPGPIVSGDEAAQSASAADWTKIWKVNSAEIDRFLADRAAGNPGIPRSILEWPGKGNPFAKGAGGVSLTLSRDFAPFVDVNADGVYNPYDGDYPKIKGSQMLWWMFNDRTAHPLSGTDPVMAEVSASAYAYATGTPASNIIFYEYEVANRGTALSDFHFTNYTDLDITYAFSDYIGIDSARRLGLMYNSIPDSLGARGNPAAGVLMVEQPGDSYGLRTPVQNIDFTDISNADNGAALYGRMSAGKSSVISWTGGLDWECTYGRGAGDRRFITSSGSRALPANGNLRYAYAFFAADSAMPCPRAYFGSSIATADTAYERYWHPSRVSPSSNPASVGRGVEAEISIYPNPAEHVLYVKTAIPNPVAQVRNAVGAIVNLDLRVVSGGLELQTSALPPGIYHLQLRSVTGIEVANSRFVKQ